MYVFNKSMLVCVRELGEIYLRDKNEKIKLGYYGFNPKPSIN